MHIDAFVHLGLALTFAYRVHLSTTRLNKEEMTIDRSQTSEPMPWPDITFCFINVSWKPEYRSFEDQLATMVKFDPSRTMLA